MSGYYKPYSDWDNKKIILTKSEVEHRIENYQNEYFEILINICSNNQSIITKNKGFTYWLERMKELQINLDNQFKCNREMSVELARRHLEEAFTPHLKSLLSKQAQKEIEEEE